MSWKSFWYFYKVTKEFKKEYVMVTIPGLQNLKYLLLDPLEKNVPNPDEDFESRFLLNNLGI